MARFGFGGFAAATGGSILLGTRLVGCSLRAVLLGARLVGGSLGVVGILLRLRAFRPDALSSSAFLRAVSSAASAAACGGSFFSSLLGQQFGLAALFGLQGFLLGAAFGFLALGGLAGCLSLGFLACQGLGLLAALFLIATRSAAASADSWESAPSP
jgi:hypothetical protein